MKLQTLVIYTQVAEERSEGGDESQTGESEKETATESVKRPYHWRQDARERLLPLVDTLELVEVDSKNALPKMETVPICHSQSSGPWNWPVWEKL